MIYMNDEGRALYVHYVDHTRGVVVVEDERGVFDYPLARFIERERAVVVPDNPLPFDEEGEK